MEFYRQNVAYSPQPCEYRRHSPNLPTPEASRSSNGSLDEQVPRTYTRNGMRICSLLTNDQPDRVTKPLDRTYNSVTGHSDSRHRSAPQGVDAAAGDRLHAREFVDGGKRCNCRGRALYRQSWSGTRVQNRTIGNQQTGARLKERWAPGSTSRSSIAWC